jgi:selenocysteine-specific elongation factor
MGQNAYLLPPGKELRVRRLERYGNHVEAVSAGDRASCNLVGLNKEDFKRGMIIADRVLKNSMLLDALLTLFSHTVRIGIWTKVVFLMDAFETQARIHLIDKDTLDGGNQAIVQIHLNEACIAQAGDRFVIRSTSGEATLGGGEIIDAAPLHHRRRPEKLVDALSKMAKGTPAQRIAAEVRKYGNGISAVSIAESLNCTLKEVVSAMDGPLPDDILEFGPDKQRFFIDKSNYDSLMKKSLRAIRSYHALHPLEANGRTADELLGILGMDRQGETLGFLMFFLGKMVNEGILQKVNATFALATHRVSVSSQVLGQTAAIEAFFKQCGMQTPQSADLARRASEAGIDDKQLIGILKYLVDKKILYGIEGVYLHAEIVDACREKLLTALLPHKEGMTVAQFRDLVSGNRKLCLLLFAIFDREGMTQRAGDVRVITEKGKAALQL